MQTAAILIVEDEVLIAEDLREQLELLGHTVVGVVDTADAAIAGARDLAPTLVLMDIRLRGDGDGIDAATLITERVDVPIIFMTAHSDAETIARALLVQPYGYVVKPVRESDLVTAIQTALLRHAAEQRLRACEGEAAAIVKNATDMVLQLLPDGRLLFGNPASRRALGYSPGQLCRMHLGNLVAQDEYEPLMRALARAAEVEHDVPIGLDLVTKGGGLLRVEGVLGQRRLGGRLDRLWAVVRPVAPPLQEPAPENNEPLSAR